MLYLIQIVIIFSVIIVTVVLTSWGEIKLSECLLICIIGLSKLNCERISDIIKSFRTE